MPRPLRTPLPALLAALALALVGAGCGSGGSSTATSTPAAGGGGGGASTTTTSPRTTPTPTTSTPTTSTRTAPSTTTPHLKSAGEISKILVAACRKLKSGNLSPALRAELEPACGKLSPSKQAALNAAAKRACEEIIDKGFRPGPKREHAIAKFCKNQ